MANSKIELCGSCCKGSQPIRKRFNECMVCACGVPFFSQIVVENNLPTSRRCLIEIPMEFMEDHGSKFDKTVSFEEEDSEVHRVKIGGNLFVGFGFEWRDFAQSHSIGIGQIIVFTLVARSRFLVQIYKPGNPSPIATKPQTSATIEVEQACPVPTQVAPKVEDDDDIEVCVAQDWLVAKASRSNTTHPVLASKVKVEGVFSETSTGQATGAPDKHGGIDVKGGQKCGIVPKVEPVLDGVDASDGIVEASNSSRRKKKLSEADSEIINEGYSVRPTPPKESPVLTTPATEERGQASPRSRSSENEENEDSDTNSSSTSDSVWSPRNSSPRDGRRRNYKRGASPASSDSDTEDEDEDEDGVEDDLVLKKFERRGKRLFSEGSSSLDKAKRKRARLSDMDDRAETDRPSPNDDDGTKSDLLVEGYLVKRHGHDWHVAGTKRGRTYVSKRRPVTEAEKEKTLERARKVQINNPSFLKQLHKDSCYRSLKLFPPTSFYRDNMISATKGSYKATLVDENGKTWQTRIMGMKIFWKHFTLDHYLEEDDVVVFELMDPRHECVTFLVHIFRVVDVKITLTGKEGWAAHYDVVEGTKKQYFEERRRLLKAEGLKKQRKQKQKRKDGSSSNPKSDTEITGFYRSKKNPEVTEFYKRSSASQGRGKGVQKEKPAPDSPNASRNQIEPRPTWKRPTTRIRSRESNQSFGELFTNPIKTVGSIKLESEEDPPLESAVTLKGNAVNSVTIPSVSEEVLGKDDSD